MRAAILQWEGLYKRRSLGERGYIGVGFAMGGDLWFGEAIIGCEALLN